MGAVVSHPRAGGDPSLLIKQYLSGDMDSRLRGNDVMTKNDIRVEVFQ
jgi:hypothetical protein